MKNNKDDRLTKEQEKIQDYITKRFSYLADSAADFASGMMETTKDYSKKKTYLVGAMISFACVVLEEERGKKNEK